MPQKCSGCDADISYVPHMECCNKNCKKLYDLYCIGITVDQISQEGKWECLSSQEQNVSEEMRVFRLEVLSHLETQGNAIKSVVDICCNTKS